jgi:putative spermidine/putrescine transport system permease protein
MNFTKNGFKSIIKKLTKRNEESFEEGNYKEQIMAVHKRWTDVDYWRAIQSTISTLLLKKNI